MSSKGLSDRKRKEIVAQSDKEEIEKRSSIINKRAILTKVTNKSLNKKSSNEENTNDSPDIRHKVRQMRNRPTTFSTDKLMVSQISEMMIEQALFWRRHANLIHTACDDITNQLSQNNSTLGSKSPTYRDSIQLQSIFPTDESTSSKKDSQSVAQLRKCHETLPRQPEELLSPSSSSFSSSSSLSSTSSISASFSQK
jgi:hypothetical protein